MKTLQNLKHELKTAKQSLKRAKIMLLNAHDKWSEDVSQNTIKAYTRHVKEIQADIKKLKDVL